MTQARSWWRSRWTILLAALVFPPAGLALLWMRPFRRLWTGVIAKLALSLPILIAGVVHLFAFYGLRAEMAGSGMTPRFTFESREDRQERLEQHRAQQHASQPAVPPAEPAPAPAPVAEPASVSSPKPVAAVAITEAHPHRAYWTNFRGPNLDGRYDQVPLLSAWPQEGLKPLWRQPIGGGYASFVVADGRAFTIEQRRDQEVVAAYDVVTGRELWTHGWKAFFQEAMGGDGPRATPTWHEGLLYALGAAGELRCLEAATGREVWRVNILEDNGASNITWGMAASPLVVDDRVIVLPGGGSGRSVVAYNKLTGKVVWRSQSDQQAYTTPVVVTLAGRRQLLVVSAERILGLSVEDGSLLWSHPWTTMYDVNSAQPIVLDDKRVFVSAGYDHGSVLLEVTSNDGRFAARPVWENKNLKNRFNSSVLYQGHIYGFDEGIFACIEAATGERKWKGGRYGYGQVVIAGDRLIVLTEEGELVLLRATPERQEELARFSAIEGKTWNHPAIADGVLLVRNAREMAAFRLAP